MAAILISHCERNLGRVKKPVGTGDPSSIFWKLDYFVRLIVLETKVCLITPTATFMPMPSIRSIWFADFLWGISLRSKCFQSSYCATVRAGAKKKKKVEGGGGGEKRKRFPTNPTILENAPWNFTVRFIFKLTACQNRSITNRLSLDYQICKIALFSNQGRPGGLVVYQYTREEFAKIPQNTKNSSKYTQNYAQVYFIPEIQRKWCTEYPYLSCNIPYTPFKTPLYTVYPKTLADPV